MYARSLNVVLLTNYVPPYRLPLFRALKNELDTFRILVSTPMSPERPWTVQHDGLDVEAQKTLTFRKVWRHPSGFRDRVYTHIPYDTLGRLLSLKPDVVISGELGARTLQACVYRGMRQASRLITWATISERTEERRGAARQLLRRAILPRADAVLVNGESGKRYTKRFGVIDERIFLVPYVIDQWQFRSCSAERDSVERRRLLYIGQLVERKGLVPFLSVLRRWCTEHPAEQIQIWLIGDGPERPKLDGARLPPNLSLRVSGSVAYDSLPSLYAQAGILAFPTLADEWGVVVNEAMAAGLPVLGSIYSQAVEELVRDGLSGWTFRPDRPEDAYAALDRALCTPPQGLQKMGHTARQAVAHLTPDFATRRFLDAISFVCGQERPIGM